VGEELRGRPQASPLARPLGIQGVVFSAFSWKAITRSVREDHIVRGPFSSDRPDIPRRLDSGGTLAVMTRRNGVELPISPRAVY